jgi:tetratricopeptide (TPR) repeat protein
MLCLVVVFGIHSLIDWTWYVPGDACVALMCAGWLAGRGPLEQAGGEQHAGRPAAALNGVAPARTLPAGAQDPTPESEASEDSGLSRPRSLRDLSPIRAVVASAVLIAVLLAAWGQWQPQGSENASQEALLLLASNTVAASAAAQTGVSRDPLSVQALFTLATVQQAIGATELARATLQRAVRLQPSNPETWLHLGEYDLQTSSSATAGAAAPGHAALARDELGAAIYLDPESIAPEAIAEGNPEAIATQNNYVQALRVASR